MTYIDGTSIPNANDHATTNGVEHRSVTAGGEINLTVLGMNSGTAMDGIDCALVHYRQKSPEAPLHMKILKVSTAPGAMLHEGTNVAYQIWITV
jgi:hypothetical protein